MQMELSFYQAQNLKDQGFKVTQLTFDANSLDQTELYLVEISEI